MKKYYSMAAGSFVGGLIATAAHGWKIGVLAAVIAFVGTSLLWRWLDK